MDEEFVVAVPELVDLARRTIPEDWESLGTIQKVLSQAGHRIVLVGGAVRNLVLGRKPNDLDLATDARPEEVQKLFRHVIPTGIQHGTVTVMIKKTGFEITTFRVDGAYTDSRRPDSVHFTQDLLEDLKRRDFTVNAMALDLESGSLIDPHQGRTALEQKIIQTVGPARERFAEDALRIVRGIRFACQLEFAIHPETMLAMEALGPSLAGVSVERFMVELKKTLASRQARRGLDLMQRCGILAVFVPELMALSALDWTRTLDSLELIAHIPGEGVMLREEQGLASLFRFVPAGKSLEDVLRRLKMSRSDMTLIQGAQRLCAEPWPQVWNDADWRRFNARCGTLSPRFMADLSAVWECADSKKPQELGGRMSVYQDRLGAVLDAKPPRSIGDLAVRGEDLAQAGIPKTALMGAVLGALLDEVLENPALNNAHWLIERAVVLAGEFQSRS